MNKKKQLSKEFRKKYVSPTVTKIKIDSDISIQMQSPPGDPYKNNHKDHINQDPFK
jgi:hypothetical protein